MLPQGTVVHAYAKYDNTTANANNPNSPPQTISWGEKTSDEMYYLPFSWVSYQSGDENINFETTVGTNDASFHAIPTRFYPISPNPAADAVKVGFTLAETGKATLRINDMQGREVETIFTDRLHYSGLFTYDIDLSRLSIGLYVVTLEVNGVQYPQKLAVVR